MMNVNTLIMASVATKGVFRRFAQLTDEQKAEVVNKVKEKLSLKSNGEETEAEDDVPSEYDLGPFDDEETTETEETVEEPAAEETSEAPEESEEEPAEESEDEFHTDYSEEGAKVIEEALNGNLEEEVPEETEEGEEAEESEEGDDSSELAQVVDDLAKEIEQIKSDGKVEATEVVGLFDNMMQMVTLLVEAKPKGRRSSIEMRVAKEFATKKELEKYLKEHPSADPARHKVIEKGGGKKKEKVPRKLKKKLKKEEEQKQKKQQEKEQAPKQKTEAPVETEAPKEQTDGEAGKQKKTWKDRLQGIKNLGAKIKEGLAAAPEKVQKFANDEEYRNETLKKVGTGIKKSPGVIGTAIWESAKAEVGEMKHAGKAVGKLATGKKLDKSDKHAIYATGVYVAGTVVAAATGAGAIGVGLAFAHSFKLHVAIKAVHKMADESFLGFEAYETVHQALDLVSHVAAEEMSEEEKQEQAAFNWVFASVVSVLDEGISDEDMAKIMEGYDYTHADQELDAMEFKPAKTASLVERVAARGLQVKRKDKDLMQDTGGVSKGREREPEKKPPRDDMKKPHRTKDKPADQRDTDTDNDKDLKKSSVHPLDRKEEMIFGLEGPEYNYYRSVWGKLVDILANNRGVSEKAAAYDDVMAEADKFLRNAEVMEIVDRFESDEKRPAFCAECLFDRIEPTAAKVAKSFIASRK